MWLPGSERYYNEFVPQNVVQGLASEYEVFSLASAVKYKTPYPPNQTNSDVISDSLYVIPRLENYADPIRQYYAAVIPEPTSKKP